MGYNGSPPKGFKPSAGPFPTPPPKRYVPGEQSQVSPNPNSEKVTAQSVEDGIINAAVTAAILGVI